MVVGLEIFPGSKSAQMLHKELPLMWKIIAPSGDWHK